MPIRLRDLVSVLPPARVVPKLTEKYMTYEVAIPSSGSNVPRDQVIKILVSQERMQGL